MVKHTRRGVRHGVRYAAVGAMVCGGLLVAQSSPGGSAHGAESGGSSRILDGENAQGGVRTDLGSRLVAELGASRTAGNWTAADGKPVVAVTDAEAAAEVSRAGARAKRVRYSMERLQSATETLRSAPRVAGTAWMVDPKTNKVMVLGDSSVSTSDWSRMKDMAAPMGEVSMERTTGTFTTKTNGAAPIFTNGSRCSAGFNVTNGQTGFILTAGHCGPPGTPWFQDTAGKTSIGTTVQTNFPGNDFSLVRYDNTKLSRNSVLDVGSSQQVKITSAADPTVGQEVFRSGATSGLRSGKVTGLNATVNYPEGAVSGLIQTTVCAEPGDSGGPLFVGNTALGVTSGGSGDCTKGGVTFFQPVTKAMTALGVTIPGTRIGDASGSADNSAIASGTQAAQEDVTSLDGIMERVEAFGPGLWIIAGGVVGFAVSLRPRRRRYTSYTPGW